MRVEAGTTTIAVNASEATVTSGSSQR